jgi:hypothetical protein
MMARVVDKENRTMAEQTKSLTPPYLAYTTFKNTLRSLGKSGAVPDRIDGSLFTSISGSARLQFLGALKYLNLIDGEKSPLPPLKSLALASDVEWPQSLAALLTKHYPAQIKLLATGTPQQVKESFGNDHPSIITPAVRFLVAAAKDAGVPVADHHKGQKGRTPGSSPRKRRRASDADAANTSGQGERISNGSVEKEDRTEPGMISFPIHMPGRDPGKIVVPSDIEEEEVVLVESAIAYLKLYAKRQAEKKGTTAAERKRE